jgi:diguanylate cyclase (GGDEF)-like protein
MQATALGARARIALLAEAVRQQSLRDALTDLPNRHFLEQHMRSLGSDGPAASGVLLMIDVDHFKRINDGLGHLAGDQALAQVADVLRSCLRQDDVLVRWGGEEFLWLAHGASMELALDLCERISEALRCTPFVLAGLAHPITVSIGLAPRPLWPLTGCDWTLSLRVADEALYLAKASGRNCWVGFPPGAPPALPVATGVRASELEGAGHLRRVQGPASARVAD